MSDTRSYFRVDNHLPDNPKIVRAGPEAELLYIHGLAYCSRLMTDGRIPKAVVPRLAWKNAAKNTSKLVEAGLWIDRDDEYEVKDYLKHQRSREQIEASRAFARRRMTLNRNPELTAAIKERDRNCCRYCGIRVNWRDRKSPKGGSYDHILPVTAGGEDEFENLVVACKACNEKKGNRTPDQAGMKLISIPIQSSIHPESIQDQHTDTDTDTEDTSPKGGANDVLAAVLQPGEIYPSSFKARLGKEIKALLGENFSPDDITAAAKKCLAKGLSPASLPSLLVEVRSNGSASKEPIPPYLLPMEGR